MREIRRRAEAWSAGYYETAVKSLQTTTMATPGETEQQLTLIKSALITNIKTCYESELSRSEVAGAIGLAPLASKISALNAALASGPAGQILAPAIAGGIFRAMSDLVITYFEDRA